MAKPFTSDSQRSCVSRNLEGRRHTYKQPLLQTRYLAFQQARVNTGRDSSSSGLSKRDLLGLTAAVTILPLLQPERAEAG